MPTTMTPKKSSRPQAFSQARNTGPSDIMTAIRTINSNAITQASMRCSACKTGHGPSRSAREQDHQRRRYRRGRDDEQHAQQRRVRPDRAVGHREQDSGVAGDVESEKPAEHGNHAAQHSRRTNFAPRRPVETVVFGERAEKRQEGEHSEDQKRPGADRHRRPDT